MNLTDLFPLLSAIFVFILGIIVLASHKRTKENVYFSLFCFGLLFWLFGTFMMFTANSDKEAIYWDRIIYIGGILNPILLYHFGRVFLKKEKIKKWILYLGYLFAIFFIVASRTDLFVSGLYKYDWGVHTQAKFLHNLFLVYFMVYMILFFVDIIKGMKQSAGVMKAQLKYIFAALLFLTVIGSPSFMPAYGYDIYPFSYLSGTVFVGIVFYAITRYRLMDIRLIMRKILVHILVSFTFLVFILGSIFTVAYFLAKRIPDYLLVFTGGITMIIALIFYDVLRRFFEKTANKFFFSSLYNYQATLEDLASHLTAVIDIQKVIDHIVSTIMKTMGLDRTGVLLLSNEKNSQNFLVAKVIGFNEQNGISLVRDNFLVLWLTNNRKSVVYEELERLIQETEDKVEKGKLLRLRTNMKRIEASLCVPLFSKNNLIGIIVLGNKVTGDAYTVEDLRLLQTIANQASIAIENARHYEEVQNFNKKLKQQVGDATKRLRELLKMKSEFLTVASHQLRTPTSIVRGMLSLVTEESDLSHEEREKFIKQAYEGINRLERIIHELLNATELEGKKMLLEFKKTRIENVVEEAVKNLEPLAQQKNIKLLFQKPREPIPQTLSDPLKLKEVVANILDNAIHYTTQGEVIVNVKRQDSRIAIEVKDTGIGMSKRDKKTLFQKFSRGEGILQIHPNGTGLGLFIAKKMTDAMGGIITAESPGKGKGSTFVIILPIR